MKLLNSTILCVFLLAFNALAHDSVSPPTKIISIYTKNSGSVYVTFESETLQGCYGNRGAYLNGTDVDKLYALLLSAKMSDKKVTVYFNFNDTAADYSGWGLCHIEAISIS